MNALRRVGQNLAVWLRVLVRPSRIPPERRAPLWPLKGWITVVALLAVIAVIAVSMLLVDAFLAGEARRLPKAVRHTFEWITWFGLSGWVLWPTGILLLVIAAAPSSKLTRISQGVL